MIYTDILEKLNTSGIALDDKTGGSSYSSSVELIEQDTMDIRALYTLKLGKDHIVDFLPASYYFECIQKTEKDLIIKLFL